MTALDSNLFITQRAGSAKLVPMAPDIASQPKLAFNVRKILLDGTQQLRSVSLARKSPSGMGIGNSV